MGFFSQLMGDLVFLRGVLRALRMTTHIAKNPARIFPNVIEELAARHGDAPALLSPRETFSYRQLFERSNRYSRWARREGIAKGETVCLLMPNRPEFMAVWLGITRIGGVTALVNTNLIGQSLAHCIDIVVAETCDRGGRVDGPVREHPAADEDRSEGLDPRRGRRASASTPPSTACPAHRSRHRSGPRSPSRTRRSTSTPRAPPACRRRPTSTITA